MIPAEGVDGGGVSLLVLAAACLAAAFMVLALLRLARRPSLVAPLLGATGVTLAIGAALYVHDAVALPEIVGTLIIGGGIGYLIGRQVRRAALPTLSAWLLGLGGVAILLTGGAVRVDPAALGITVPGQFCLILAMALGGATVGAALLVKGEVGRILPAAMTGWAAAALGFALGNVALILCGGVLGAAGSRLAASAIRSKRDRPTDRGDKGTYA